MAAQVKRHQKVKIIIGMGREGKGGKIVDRNPDAEFFLKLADKRRFGRLPGVKLAAWKFPLAGEGFSLGTPGDQHVRARVHQRRCHNEKQRPRVRNDNRR